MLSYQTKVKTCSLDGMLKSSPCCSISFSLRHVPFEMVRTMQRHLLPPWPTTKLFARVKMRSRHAASIKTPADRFRTGENMVLQLAFYMKKEKKPSLEFFHPPGPFGTPSFDYVVTPSFFGSNRHADAPLVTISFSAIPPCPESYLLKTFRVVAPQPTLRTPN